MKTTESVVASRLSNVDLTEFVKGKGHFMPISVLMQARPNLFAAPGGDTTQLLKTADALRALGVS